MNFDDFDLSTFDIDSQIPSYAQVNNSNKTIQNEETSKNTINYSKKIRQNQKDEPDDNNEENGGSFRERKRVVSPIMSGQFEPFSNFFITITTIQNIDNCSNRSLFLKIRIHPSIPIIETPCVWCSNRDAVFNVAYSLDFTKIAPFNLGDFTPVIELYRRFNSSNDLIAVTLLPLKTIKEVVRCGPRNQYLTYLYRDSPITLRDLTIGSSFGCMKVTIAFGFPEHERLLDPNSKNILTPNLFYNGSMQIPNGTDVNNQYQQNVVRPNALPVQIENIAQNVQLESPYNAKPVKKTEKKKAKPAYEYDDESDDDQNSRHHHRSRHSSRRDRSKRNKKKDDFNWVDEAITLGWKPPGSSDFDWKAKAREKGWKAPNEAIMSDIGVYVDPNGNNMRQFRTSIGIQTYEVQKQILILPEIKEKEEETASTTNSNDDLELIELLNPKLKKNQEVKTKSKTRKKEKTNVSTEKPNLSIAKPLKNEKFKKNLHISEPQSYSEEIKPEKKSEPQRKQLNFVKCITLFEESPNPDLVSLDDDNDESPNIQDRKMLEELLNPSNVGFPKQISFKNSLKSKQIIDKICSTDSNSVDSDDNSIEKSKNSILMNNSKENANSITPIDHEEMLKSPSLFISDSDSDVNDMHDFKNMAMNDKSFYEIYSKYLD